MDTEYEETGNTMIIHAEITVSQTVPATFPALKARERVVSVLHTR